MTNDITSPSSAGSSRTDANKENYSSPREQKSSSGDQNRKENGTPSLDKVADQALTKFSDVSKTAGKYVREKPLMVAGLALLVGYFLGSRRR